MIVTKQMLQNDLTAAKLREELLLDTCDNLRRDLRSQTEAMHKLCIERDDWRDAFKLIMKLVK